MPCFLYFFTPWWAWSVVSGAFLAGHGVHRQFDLVDVDAFGCWGHVKDTLEVVRPGRISQFFDEPNLFFFLFMLKDGRLVGHIGGCSSISLSIQLKSGSLNKEGFLPIQSTTAKKCHPESLTKCDLILSIFVVRAMQLLYWNMLKHPRVSAGHLVPCLRWSAIFDCHWVDLLETFACLPSSGSALG